MHKGGSFLTSNIFHVGQIRKFSKVTNVPLKMIFYGIRPGASLGLLLKFLHIVLFNCRNKLLIANTLFHFCFLWLH